MINGNCAIGYALLIRQEGNRIEDIDRGAIFAMLQNFAGGITARSEFLQCLLMLGIGCILGAQYPFDRLADGIFSTPTIDDFGGAIPTLDPECQISGHDGVAHILLQTGIKAQLLFMFLALANIV